MPHTLTVDYSKPIRLFPLAQCILLPHATVPLHIFEHRYRAMTRDALDSDGLIAMATFKGDDYQYDYQGTPPIRSTVCLGYVVHHERLTDGRYNILLQGIARASILEECPLNDSGYRTAILKPIEQRIMELDLEDQRKSLESLLNDPYLQELNCIQNVNHWLSPDLPTPVIIDLAWQATTRNTEQRYGILAEPCVYKRYDRLHQYLQRTRRTLTIAKHMGSCTSETGLPLN